MRPSTELLYPEELDALGALGGSWELRKIVPQQFSREQFFASQLFARTIIRHTFFANTVPVLPILIRSGSNPEKTVVSFSMHFLESTMAWYLLHVEA